MLPQRVLYEIEIKIEDIYIYESISREHRIDSIQIQLRVNIYIDSIYIYYICNIPRLRTVEAVEGFNLDYRVGPGSEVGYIAPYISTIDSR